MAEQIRQQQLAAALESRLDAQSFNAMQTAMLMNKLTKGAAVADTTKLLLEAAAASEQKQNNSKSKTKAGKGKTAKNNFGLGGDKLNRNTVASLLAKSRELSCGTNLTPEELEQAERSALQQPELTIEPIFRNLKPDQSVQSGDDFDTSDNGRRLTSVMEDGKLKIKTVSDSPEIRNLSDHEGSASDSDDGREITTTGDKSDEPSSIVKVADSTTPTPTNNNSKPTKTLSNNSSTLLSSHACSRIFGFVFISVLKHDNRKYLKRSASQYTDIPKRKCHSVYFKLSILYFTFPFRFHGTRFLLYLVHQISKSTHLNGVPLLQVGIRASTPRSRQRS